VLAFFLSFIFMIHPNHLRESYYPFCLAYLHSGLPSKTASAQKTTPYSQVSYYFRSYLMRSAFCLSLSFCHLNSSTLEKTYSHILVAS
jgi:hypothetical protein